MGINTQKWESAGPSQWLPITAPYPFNPHSTISPHQLTQSTFHSFHNPAPSLLTYFTPLSNPFTNSKPDNNSRGSSKFHIFHETFTSYPLLLSTPLCFIIILHNLPLNYLLPGLIIQSMFLLIAYASPESL